MDSLARRILQLLTFPRGVRQGRLRRTSIDAMNPPRGVSATNAMAPGSCGRRK